MMPIYPITVTSVGRSDISGEKFIVDFVMFFMKQLQDGDCYRHGASPINNLCKLIENFKAVGGDPKLLRSLTSNQRSRLATKLSSCLIHLLPQPRPEELLRKLDLLV